MGHAGKGLPDNGSPIGEEWAASAIFTVGVKYDWRYWQGRVGEWDRPGVLSGAGAGRAGCHPEGPEGPGVGGPHLLACPNNGLYVTILYRREAMCGSPELCEGTLVLRNPLP
ncbi:MAG: hypothetical protein OXN80_03720 [bacterium]|nr:hypothetical protein [bacterium]